MNHEFTCHLVDSDGCIMSHITHYLTRPCKQLKYYLLDNNSYTNDHRIVMWYVGTQGLK